MGKVGWEQGGVGVSEGYSVVLGLQKGRFLWSQGSAVARAIWIHSPAKEGKAPGAVSLTKVL